VLGWIAAFVNVMAFNQTTTLLPIPSMVGQLVTQAALPVALAFMLMTNPKGVLRPNIYLVVLSVLAIETLAVSIHNQFLLGATFRAVRFLEFVAVLWLASPWFARRDMMLLRCYRLCLGAVLGLVVLGAAVSPGRAFSFEGRLSGIIWPIPPTQVAHYAAIMLGTTALLWMCQVISGRHSLLIVSLSAAIQLGTHTRTALVAMSVALVISTASLFVGHARVRRTSMWSLLLALAAVAVFANEIKVWILRGQSSEQAGQLTGRTEVWAAVTHAPRSTISDVFGSGMSNLSFNGLPIDSNWIGTYLDMGWFGVLLCAAMFLLLLVVVVTRERTPHRAIALFLIVYCIFASITETGMSNPSPYLLDLAVAASLILPSKETVR
jgi:hypothetical protein